MLRHRTTDPAARADHIADRLAEAAYRFTVGHKSYTDAYNEIYPLLLQEMFDGLPEGGFLRGKRMIFPRRKSDWRFRQSTRSRKRHVNFKSHQNSKTINDAQLA